MRKISQPKNKTEAQLKIFFTKNNFKGYITMRWKTINISEWKVLLVILSLCSILAIWQWNFTVTASTIVFNRLFGHHTVDERMGQYSTIVRKRLSPFFQNAGIVWPARKITLVGLKRERLLEVWATDKNGTTKLVRIYQILGTSGNSGPKLLEGDGQIPEGIYDIDSLNPNSAYHLSLRINYPNAADRTWAREDGRKQLGGDIMIHGNCASAGCLAMGDEAAEDLFVMVALAGLTNVTVVLAPCDLRLKAFPPPKDSPKWTSELYRAIKDQLPMAKTELLEKHALP